MPPPPQPPLGRGGGGVGRGGGGGGPEPVPPPSAYAVTATVKVGRTSRTRYRIPIFLHAFPRGGVTDTALEEQLRKRVTKWVRRAFAQADMAPIVVGFEMLAVPVKHMLFISGAYEKVGQRAGGISTTGKTAADGKSKLTLTVTVTDKVATTTETKTVDVPLSAGLDPLAIGALAVTKLGEQGITAAACSVPTAEVAGEFEHSGLAIVGCKSCDLVLAQPVGKAVEFAAATQDDAGLKPDTLSIPFVDFSTIKDNQPVANDDFAGGLPEQRFILRWGKTADDRIDVYVIPDGRLGGRAFPRYLAATDVGFRAEGALGAAVLMAYKSQGKGYMDGSDQCPFTLPHELGHVLAETGHTVADGCVMHGSGSATNTADANKRIYSGMLKVGSPSLDALGRAAPVDHPDQDMYADIIKYSAGKLLKPW